MSELLRPGMRPALEYHYAFDRCAMIAHRINAPTLIVTSQQFHSYELIQRVNHLVSECAPYPPQRRSSEHLHIIWAEPTTYITANAARISTLLHSGEILTVQVAGQLARLLPEWKQTNQPCGLLPIIFLLARSGFLIETVEAYHGPLSVAWASLARLCEYLDREDLTDRCIIGMRSTFTVGPLQAIVAPISVITARRR